MHRGWASGRHSNNRIIQARIKQVSDPVERGWQFVRGRRGPSDSFSSRGGTEAMPKDSTPPQLGFPDFKSHPARHARPYANGILIPVGVGARQQTTWKLLAAMLTWHTRSFSQSGLLFRHWTISPTTTPLNKPAAGDAVYFESRHGARRAGRSSSRETVWVSPRCAANCSLNFIIGSCSLKSCGWALRKAAQKNADRCRRQCADRPARRSGSIVQTLDRHAEGKAW